MVLRPGEEDTGRLVVENGIALKCFRFQLDDGRTDIVETNNDKLTSSIYYGGWMSTFDLSTQSGHPGLSNCKYFMSVEDVHTVAKLAIIGFVHDTSKISQSAA